MKTVILKTFETSWEAYLAKGKLQNEGIDCFITNENFSALMPHFYRMLGSGVHVMINEDDLKKASNLLAEGNEEIACPNCGSTNLKFGFGKNKVKKWIWITLSILSWVPFNNLNNRYMCRKCKTEFKTDLA